MNGDFSNNTHTNMNNVHSTTMKTTMKRTTPAAATRGGKLELELPIALYEAARKASEAEGVSVEQLIVTALQNRFLRPGARAEMNR